MPSHAYMVRVASAVVIVLSLVLVVLVLRGVSSHSEEDSGAAFCGRVTGAEGKGLADATVRRRLPGAVHGEGSGETTTGDDGTYCLPGRPTHYVLEASAPGHVSEQREVTLEPPRTPLDFALRPTVIVTGRVVGPEERPVPRASLEAFLPRPKDAPPGWWKDHRRTLASASSEPDGTFRLETLAAGDYVLESSTPLLKSQAMVFHAPSTNLQVSLDSSGTIVGTVLDEEGNPAADATVELGSLTSASCNPATRNVRADSAGRFVFTELPPGEYCVEASLPLQGSLRRCARAQTQVVPAKGAPAVSPPLLRLPAPEPLTGVLLDDAGQPVTGAGVFALPESSFFCETRRGVTDSQGRFTLQMPSRGPFNVGAVLRPGDSRFVGAVKVRAGEPVPVTLRAAAEPITPTLSIPPPSSAPRAEGPPGAIEGTLLDALGQPFRSHMKVSAIGARPSSRWADVAADGHYRLEGLAPGEYQVEGHLDSGLPQRPFTHAVVQVPPGGVAKADLRERSRGVTLKLRVAEAQGEPTERLITVVFPGALPPLTPENFGAWMDRSVRPDTSEFDRSVFTSLPPGAFTVLVVGGEAGANLVQRFGLRLDEEGEARREIMLSAEWERLPWSR